MIRIVLVEDDDLMREWLGRSLTSRGFSVSRFARAEHALPAIAADPPHVVVSDVRMPGMSGFEMGHALRARGIHVPFVFMTADPSVEVDSRLAELGVRDLLRKPFGDVAELWQAVDDALAACGVVAQADLTETSHALRTPLTALRMAFDGLLKDRELDPAERHLMDIAARNFDRLATAVEDHLARLALISERRSPGD